MPVFGDAEAATVAILAADPGVLAFTGIRISTDLLGYRAPARWVRVTRTGGVPTPWMVLDNPILAINVFAENKGTGLDIAGAARAAVFAARGTYVGHGLSLFDVADSDGLQWAPDPLNAALTRYQFALSLLTRPA